MKQIRHGTIDGYNRFRCRCEQCRAAKSADKFRRTRTRTGLPPGDPRHGTLNAYTNWRCRCPECVTAGQTYRAEHTP